MRVTILRKSATQILLWMQRALFAGALVTLGYCGFVAAESWNYQRHAATELARIERLPPAPSTIPLSPLEPGALFGRIDVDRLHVSVAIAEGSDAATLEHAAGHISGTALPGDSGNIGIAAHRDTFFRPIRGIHNDDIIRLTTRGEYRYRVVSTRVVGPGDVSVLESDGSEVLTLVTCYPFYYIGPAPRRFIVRAERDRDPVVAAVTKQ